MIQTSNITWCNHGCNHAVKDHNSLPSQSNTVISSNIIVNGIANSHSAPPVQHEYACPKCTKSFKRGDHLKRHLISVHDQSHPYHCGDCSKGFPTVETLVKHNQASHCGVSTKGPFCAWCGVKFSSVADLESHAYSMHIKQDADYMQFINKTCKVFGCHICGKTVSTEKILFRHIEKAHNEGKNGLHFCSKCNASFSSVSDLQAHRKQAHNSKRMKNKHKVSASVNQNEPLMTEDRKTILYDQMQWQAGVQMLQHNVLTNHTNVIKSAPPHKSNELHHVYINSIHNQGYAASSENCYNDAKMHVLYDNVSSTNSYPVIADIKLQSHVPNNSFDKFSSKNQQSKKLADSSNTVSEALALAMNALSDFSYEDLFSTSYEYIPAGYSIFKSSSPLPNFHYPSTVQLANLVDDETTNSPTSNQFSIIKTSSLHHQLSQCPSPTIQLHSQTPFNGVGNNTVDGATANHAIDSKAFGDNAYLLARRGRPKKNKVDANCDDEQTLIRKTSARDNKVIFSCTMCNLSFEGVDNVMRHLEGVHLSANPQECCLCKKRFAQAGNVKRHIRFVHLRERPFQCADCDCMFDRLCYLQRHMRSHIDVCSDKKHLAAHLLPSNCPVCGKHCLTAHHLRGHMQRKHFAKSNKSSEEMLRKYNHLFENETICKHNQKKDKHESCKNNSKIKSIKCDSAILNGVINVSSNQSNVALSSQVFEKSKSPGLIKKYLLNGTNHRSKFKKNRSNRIKPERTLNFSVCRLSKVLFRSKTRCFLPYKCRHCLNRGFPSLCFLKSHLAIVHHSTTRRHVCYCCGISYFDRASLEIHMKKRHF